MMRGLEKIQIEETSPTGLSINTNGKYSPTDLEIKEDQLFDESTESETTVIHYEDSKFRFGNVFSISQDEEDSKKIQKITSKINNYVVNIPDKYINNLKSYKNEIFQELQSLFEECQFDIISNHMNPSARKENQYKRRIYEIEENKILLQLSKTPYPLLIHSIKPQLITMSLLCFLRKYFKQIRLKNLIELIVLSTTILNMSNNSLLGMKFYSQMMINRTKRIINQLLRLEQYFFACNDSINNISNRRNIQTFKISKFNLINSSMHFMISMLVNRIGRIVSFGMNKCTLKKYITIYGLDDESEEIKVLRNVVKNTSSCACTWYNEPIRILRTLRYIREVLICTLMSSMEIGNNMKAEAERENADFFLKRFWNKLGVEESMNTPHLMISTRILGIANELKDMSVLLARMDDEIVDDELLVSFESATNEDLAVVNERNEDDRVFELGRMIEQLAIKVDLIELGKTNFTLGDLKDDVSEFFTYYNDVTSGRTAKRDTSNLRRLRMSEILFDDEDNKGVKQKRRSSGMNFPIVSVVKNEESLIAEENGQNTETEEFQRVLEKLCSRE